MFLIKQPIFFALKDRIRQKRKTPPPPRCQRREHNVEGRISNEPPTHTPPLETAQLVQNLIFSQIFRAEFNKTLIM